MESYFLSATIFGRIWSGIQRRLCDTPVDLTCAACVCLQCEWTRWRTACGPNAPPRTVSWPPLAGRRVPPVYRRVVSSPVQTWAMRAARRWSTRRWCTPGRQVRLQVNVCTVEAHLIAAISVQTGCKHPPNFLLELIKHPGRGLITSWEGPNYT